MKSLIFLGDSITDSNHLWPTDVCAPCAGPDPGRNLTMDAGPGRNLTMGADPGRGCNLTMGAKPGPGHRLTAGSAQGPGPHSLGDGYVSMLSEPLAQRFPGIQIRNKGQDGFTAGAVLRSLEWNCLAFKPDAVSLLIGVNDGAVAQNTGRSLTDIGFRAQIHAILEKLLSWGVQQIFCMGPFLFPWPTEYQNWFPRILEAEGLFRDEAKAFGLPFLPLQDAMNDAASRADIPSFTPDGIHLTREGHRFLAAQWLNAFIPPESEA